MLRLHEAHDEPAHGPERHQQVRARTPAARQRLEQVLGPVERRVVQRAPRQDERHHVGMAAQRAPCRFHDGAHVDLPVAARSRPDDLRQHRLDHQGVEIVAITHVVVERHRARAERAGEAAHRQGRKPIAIDQRERRGLELRSGESALCRHRLLP